MNHEKREKGSPVAQGRLSKVAKTLRYRAALGALVATLLAAVAAMTAPDEPQGWLVIEGGSYPLNPVVAQRFRDLIGGADCKVLLIPTAFDDERIQKEVSSGNFDKAAKAHMGLRNY